MTPYELAVARRRAYNLFGRLFLEGITADLLPLLEAVPELQKAAGQIDLDQAAADHYQLTAVSVFPYESIFLDPSGLLGGPVSDSVISIYAQNGYDVLSDADHIGHELLFMSHLCAAEATALAGGEENASTQWQSRQQAFLSSHLLTWLAPFTVAIERSESDFYGRLANLTLTLCADHLSTIPANGSPPTLPRAPELAADNSSLKEIARTLNTPPYSGLFLSRDAISALARHRNLPRGFGDRVQLLTNLLRTAGSYDLAPDVLTDLSALCAGWADCYMEQQDTYPNLLPWIGPWHDHVVQTAVSLNEITAVLENAQTPGSH